MPSKRVGVRTSSSGELNDSLGKEQTVTLMLEYLKYAGLILVAYLVGSIPMGLLVVRAVSGVDVRTVGSGRTGGTNAFRAGGVLAGILTGVGDLLKGFIAVSLPLWLFGDRPFLLALCGIAAVAGHNWSVFIGFRGGAGTGTNVGAAVAIWPLVGLWLVPLVPALLVVTGYASVTSTVTCAVLLIGFLIRAAVGGAPWEYAAYSAVTLIMVALALLPNYRRLLEGTERMVGPRARRLGKNPR